MDIVEPLPSNLCMSPTHKNMNSVKTSEQVVALNPGQILKFEAAIES